MKFYLQIFLFLFSIQAQASKINTYTFHQQENNVLRYDCKFQSEKPAQFYIKYWKKNNAQEVFYTDTTELSTSHKITIMCLYENTKYAFQVYNTDGEIFNKGSFKTKALPDFVKSKDSIVNHNFSFKGYFFYDLTRDEIGNPRYTKCMKAIDANGKTVWYEDLRKKRIATCTISDKQELVIVNNIFINDKNEILSGEIPLDSITKLLQLKKVKIVSQLEVMKTNGEILSTSQIIPFFVNHDCIKLKNGNFLMIVWEKLEHSEGQYTVSNLIETNAEGDVLKKWNVAENVKIESLINCITSSWGVIEAVFGKQSLDCYHINSLYEDVDSNIIVSFKNCNLIAKIEWKNKTGNLIWNVNSPIDLNLKSAFAIDNNDYFYDQHGVVFDAKKNDIWMFDNGNKDYRKYSKAMIFHLNFLTRKLEKKFEYILPEKYFSVGKGSFVPIDNQSYIICSGLKGYFAVIDKQKKLLFEFKSDIQNYRVYPIYNFYDKHYTIKF